MRKILALVIGGIVLFFLFFERGEHPLSFDEMTSHLKAAGFVIEPQNELLFYSDQEALLPERPGRLFSARLSHREVGSNTVTPAGFSSERVPQWLDGQTNGFPARNWFFFGIINKAMTQKVQEALAPRKGDISFRLRVSKAELKPLVWEALDGAKQRPKEEVLRRGEIFAKFNQAGLKINRVEEDRKMPSSVKKKLPAEPLDDFLLFIEDEGVFPIEFASVEDAIAMQKKHKKGFRHGNWYFPGQITASLRKKLRAALQAE